MENNSDQRCQKCGGLIKIRNPTGKCDHLYYPDNIEEENRISVSMKTISEVLVWICLFLNALSIFNLTQAIRNI